MSSTVDGTGAQDASWAEPSLEGELDHQLQALEAALERDPSSPHVRRAVELAREQKDLAQSLIAQARDHERDGRISNALEQWRTLGAVHPDRADIARQIERLRARLRDLEQDLSATSSALEDAENQEAADLRRRASQLAELVAKLELPRRGGQAVNAVRKGVRQGAPRAARGVTEALIWMQTALGGAKKPTAAGDGKPSPWKPVIFLGGGILFTLVLAMLFGPSGSAPPGPAPHLQQISVEAAPAETQIFIDGEPCGYGSCEAAVEAGRHEISGRLPGYAAAREMIAVDPAEGGQGQSIRLSLAPLTPELELTTDLGSGQVFLDGELVGAVEEGSLRLESLPFGEHEIRFAGGGLSTTLRYRAAPGEPVVLTEPIEAVELKVAVAAGLSDQVRLYTAADGATVRLDDAEAAEVGVEGFKPDAPAYGLHEAVFSDGSSVGFEIGLRPVLVASLTSDRNVGALRVVAGADDATVYLNGKAYRRKTARGGLLVYLRPGEYAVRVEKAGFRPAAEQTVTIEKGRRATVEAPLTPEPQTASLVVRGGPPGAAVLIDGERAGSVDPSGAFRIGGVEPGEHVVEIRRDGYEAKRVRREFPKKSEVEVDGGLSLIVGGLRIEVTPADAPVRLRLQREGDSSARAVTERELELPPGVYTVTGEAPGFQRYAATVLVEAGTRKTAEILLQESVQAAPTPRDLIPALDRLGWSRHGDLRVRAADGFAVIPVGPGPGVYEVTLERQRGRIQWAANYRDDANHVLYQIKKNELVRTTMKGGEESEQTVRRRAFALDTMLSFRIAVSSGTIVTSTYDGAEWVEVDRLTGEGLDGRFAFYTSKGGLLGRSDQIGVRSFSFTPAD